MDMGFEIIENDNLINEIKKINEKIDKIEILCNNIIESQKSFKYSQFEIIKSTSDIINNHNKELKAIYDDFDDI